MQKKIWMIGGIAVLSLLTGCVHTKQPITYEEFEHRAGTFAGTVVRDDGNFIVGTNEAPTYRRNFMGDWVLEKPKRRKYLLDVRDVPPEAALAKVGEEWRTIPNNPYAPMVEPVTVESEDPPVAKLRNWLRESEWGKK